MGTPQGKRERRLRCTFGWPWLDGRWPEEAGPRRVVAGGGSARWWRCSGGVSEGRSGSGVLVERGEASGAVGLENVGARRTVHNELGSPAVMAAGGLGMGVARAVGLGVVL